MKYLGEATPEEVAAAFSTRVGTTYERVNDEQAEYVCKRCTLTFHSDSPWIMSSLCDECFAETDREKWEQRLAVSQFLQNRNRTEGGLPEPG